MLRREFYQKPTLDVAKSLLGKVLIRKSNNTLYKAMIVETEAYIGKEDSACHASKGMTPRTEVMFGEAGHAYIYFVYGMHYMLNIVTEDTGFPAAVLLRAAEPIENGLAMINNRGGQARHIANGPARLCQALNIDKSLNGIDLTLSKALWLDEYKTVSKKDIITRPRIGINYADLADREALWRFYLRGNTHVSRK